MTSIFVKGSKKGTFLVVVSEMYGGARLSDAAIKLYETKSGGKKIGHSVPADCRTRRDPVLIAVIQELGDKANGEVYGFTSARWRLKNVKNIYWDTFFITNYDGLEFLHLPYITKEGERRAKTYGEGELDYEEEKEEQ
jgi:hypothetical protein